jgi:O-antigen/teichoic acid export membrane protein
MSGTTLPTPERIPLKRRVLTASVWSLAGYGLSQVIRFGSNLIMTRLLVPEMFGVMAITMVVMVGLAMFSDLGVGQSIIRSQRGADGAFLNTAWAVQIVRGLVLCLIGFAIALAVYFTARTGVIPDSSVYADPSLPWVIAVMSFGTVIGGFTTTKAYEASRSLALGRPTLIELAAQVAGLCAMLAWASRDRSIWALVVGSLIAGAASVVIAHAWLPGTPNRWQWDRSAVKEILHFGKWIFASSLLGFIVASVDRLLLGTMVDATTLGIYAIAVLILSAVDQMVRRISGGVTLSALSEVARNNGDLRAAYYRLHAAIAAIAYVSAGFLMTSGQPLMAILYDHRYADAGWMLQILAASLVMAPSQIAVQAYLALGTPQLLSRILLVRLVALVALIPTGFLLFGLPGALWGVVLGQFSSLPLFILYNTKSEIFDLRRELLLLPTVLVGMGLGRLAVMVLESVRA